jgi:hypothetical protein
MKDRVHGKALVTWVYRSEFREIKSIPGQVAYFRVEGHCFTWETISDLFGKPTTTLNRWYDHHTGTSKDPEIADCADLAMLGPNGFLNIGEEKQVIEWIRSGQEDRNCVTSRQVRDYATQLRRARIADERVATKHWWSHFKNRHPQLDSKLSTAMEKARCEVAGEDVERYYGEVRNALQELKCREQLLNMDETGFCTRATRDKKKRIVYLSDCPVKPTFSDVPDGNHVSLVATISFSLKPLKPMLLTCTDVKYRDSDLQIISGDLATCRTEKAYQTEASMIRYVQEISLPYSRNVRNWLQNPDAPIFLIMDNCASHRTEQLQSMYQQHKIRVIWLPPHSSHFLQPLDLFVFGILKKKYQDIKAKPVTLQTPKLESKILRIHRAWADAVYPLQVFRSWAAAAISCQCYPPVKWGLSEDRVLRKIQENCRVPAERPVVQ